MKNAWERIKRGVAWLRKNEDTIGGGMVIVAGLFCAVVECSTSDTDMKPPREKKKETESTTVRQDASSMWHRAKCAVRLCDEEGRCPVWSSKYSKCYMLDREGERILRYYEREGARKEQIESWSPELFGK